MWMKSPRKPQNIVRLLNKPTHILKKKYDVQLNWHRLCQCRNNYIWSFYTSQLLSDKSSLFLSFVMYMSIRVFEIIISIVAILNESKYYICIVIYYLTTTIFFVLSDIFSMKYKLHKSENIFHLYTIVFFGFSLIWHFWCIMITYKLLIYLSG